MNKIKILTGPNGHEKIKEVLRIVHQENKDFTRMDWAIFDFFTLNRYMFEASMTDRYLVLDNCPESVLSKLIILNLCIINHTLDPKQYAEFTIFDDECNFTRPDIIISLNSTKSATEIKSMVNIPDFDQQFEVNYIHTPIV